MRSIIAAVYFHFYLLIDKCIAHDILVLAANIVNLSHNYPRSTNRPPSNHQILPIPADAFGHDHCSKPSHSPSNVCVRSEPSSPHYHCHHLHPILDPISPYQSRNRAMMAPLPTPQFASQSHQIHKHLPMPFHRYPPHPIPHTNELHHRIDPY